MSGAIVPSRKGKNSTASSEDSGGEGKMEAHPIVGADTLRAMVEVCKAMAQDVDDETAVQAKALFADYEDVIGQTVNEGYRFRYGGELYKTTQETEITAENVPGAGTEDIYEDIG